jgi:hypothetical protein
LEAKSGRAFDHSPDVVTICVSPPAGVRAQLAETPAGWVLTLHCDAATAAGLRAAVADLLGPGRLSISITPNLVPGKPFAIDTVLIAVDKTS